MNIEEFWGALGHHKGELGQSAWKQMNESVYQGVLVNSRCPKDKVLGEF